MKKTAYRDAAIKIMSDGSQHTPEEIASAAGMLRPSAVSMLNFFVRESLASKDGQNYRLTDLGMTVAIEWGHSERQ